MHVWQKADAQCKPIGLKREYVQVTGDLASACLLSQIVYWHRPDKNGKTRLRVFRDGKLWAADRVSKWTVACQISEGQYKRAVKNLTQLGLVEHAIYKFAGITVPHFALNHQAFAEALAGVFDEVTTAKTAEPPQPKQPDPFGQNDLTTSVKTAEPYSTKISTKISTEISVAADAAEENMNELNSVLENHMKKKGQVIPGEHLAITWKKRYSSQYGGWHQELSTKDMALLKKLKELLGEKAVEVVEFVLANWGKFCWQVKGDKGLTTSPEKPIIGYLFSHYGVALQLIAVKEEQPVLPPPKPMSYTVDVPKVETPTGMTKEQQDMLLHFKQKAQQAQE